MSDRGAFSKVTEYVVSGDSNAARSECERLLKENADPKAILKEGLIQGMRFVGEKMKSGEFYITDVLLAADAMNAGLEVLKPHLAEDESEALPVKVVLGTVEGDLHSIGKNLVKVMWEGAGIKSLDLGIDVPTDRFVAESKDAIVLAMSALMTTTTPALRKVIDAVKEAGFRDKIKILVGGAAVTEKYATSIGADRYGRDAYEALVILKFVLQLEG